MKLVSVKEMIWNDVYNTIWEGLRSRIINSIWMDVFKHIQLPEVRNVINPTRRSINQ